MSRKRNWQSRAWKLDIPLVAAENFAETEMIRQKLLSLSSWERVLYLYHILAAARGNNEKIEAIKRLVYSGKWTAELGEAAKYFAAGVKPTIRGRSPLQIVNARKLQEVVR